MKGGGRRLGDDHDPLGGQVELSPGVIGDCCGRHDHAAGPLDGEIVQLVAQPGAQVLAAPRERDQIVQGDHHRNRAAQ